MTVRDLGLVIQVFDEQKLRALDRRHGGRPRALLDDRLVGVGERAAGLPLRPPRARARAQRQPDQRGRAAHRAARARASRSARPRTRRSSPRCSRPTRPTRSRRRSPTSMPRLQGAFSTVVMTPRRRGRVPRPRRAAAAGARADRRPLLRRLARAARSTSSAPSCVREVEPGEMVVARRARASSRARSSRARAGRSASSSTSTSPAPTRILEGNRTAGLAAQMGEILWREAPVEADLVIAVPDSGNPAAAGFAKASGIPQDDGLIKNRYVARTFIQPGQELRKHGLRMKFNPLPRGRRGQAAGRRRRLDRARQHHPPDRRRCCATPARPRSTCGSPRRRSASPATTASTCRRPRRWSPTAAPSRRSPRSSSATRSPTSRSRASTRRSAASARDPLRRLLHRRVPARRHRRRPGQVRVRAARRQRQPLAPVLGGARPKPALEHDRPRHDENYERVPGGVRELQGDLRGADGSNSAEEDGRDEEQKCCHAEKLSVRDDVVK